MENEDVKINLEDQFAGMFQSATGGGGVEELLRIASTYARQMTSEQIKAILYLQSLALKCRSMGKKLEETQLNSFVKNWLDLKQYNHSDIFVMKALEFISLRKFISDQTFRVNLEK